MKLEQDLFRILPQEMRSAYSHLFSFFGDLSYQQFNALVWSYGLYLLKPDAAELNLNEAIIQKVISRFPDCSVISYPGVNVPKLRGISTAELVYPANYKSLSRTMPEVAACMDEYLGSGPMTILSVKEESLKDQSLSLAMENLRGPSLREAFDVEGNLGFGYVEHTLRGMKYSDLKPAEVDNLRRALSTGTIFDRTAVAQRNLVHLPDSPEEMIGVLALLPFASQDQEMHRMKQAINLTQTRRR